MGQQAQGDDEKTAFPASAATPGQRESRQARQRFLDLAKDIDGEGKACPWLNDYLQLRLEGWDWRRAAYIAWKSSAMGERWPATQQELATKVLGLRSDRTIRTWIEKNPEIEERVARLQVEPLFQFRRDAIQALMMSVQRLGRDGAADRRTYFTMTGDLKPGKGGQDNDRKGSSSDSPFAGMSEEELELTIRNLQAAAEMEHEGGLDAGDDADDDADGADSTGG